MRLQRKTIFAVIVLFVSTFAVLGICEVVFRAFLFSDTLSQPSLRQAWRYADGNFDDDFWKLVFLFSNDQGAPNAGSVDPELGWTPQTSPPNPLGILTNRPYRFEDVVNQPVLFYGDSFVAGVTTMPDRIPQILDRLFLPRPVLNYGVSGYGLDQIYLRFSKTVTEFNQPWVLVGILTQDLDRSILSVRGAQKPYFEVEDGELALRNSPIMTTMDEFIESNPPEIRSYFARFALFRLRNYLPKQWFNFILDYNEKQIKKLSVNRALLKALKADSEAWRLPLYVVIFYSWEGIQSATWREDFLKNTLDEFGIQYFDTKPLLLQYIAETGTDPYDENHGHLSRKGNRLVAESLMPWLEAQRLADIKTATQGLAE